MVHQLPTLIEAHEFHEVGALARVASAGFRGHAQTVILHQVAVARFGLLVRQPELRRPTEDPAAADPRLSNNAMSGHRETKLMIAELCDPKMTWGSTSPMQFRPPV